MKGRERETIKEWGERSLLFAVSALHENGPNTRGDTEVPQRRVSSG